MTKFRLMILSSTATVSLIAASSEAQAQSTDAAAASNAASQEIVVTAQKRSEREVDVPISITTASAKELTTKGVNDVAGLAQIVPGLRIDFSGAFSQPTIRGVGSATIGPGISSNVATYIDGVIRPSSLSNNVTFDDIASVEVLKGPQGTLFGRNATGGAILITTQNPTFDTHAQVHVSYGSYNEVRSGASVSSGLTDTIAASLSVTQARSDGFVKNVFTGDNHAGKFNNWGVRAKLLFKPSSSASFLLAFEHLESDDHRPTELNDYRGYSAAALVPGAIVPSARGITANDYPGFGKASSNAVTLKSVFDLGGGIGLTSYSGFQIERDHNSSDIDGSSAAIEGVAWPIHETTVSQEINLTGKSAHFNWVVGAYYFHNRSNWPGLGLGGAVVGGLNFLPLVWADVKTDSFAGFADGTYEVIPNLYLTAGLRYSHDRAAEVQTTLGSPTITPNHSWSAVTPRAVIRYQLTPGSNIYASFSRGYKAGVFNSSTNQIDPVNPEHISAWEVGYKTSVPGGLRFEAAGYYYTYSNLQVASYTAFGAVLANAASSRIYGIDAKLTAPITSELTATLAGAWTHARYTRFPGAAGYIFVPPAGTASYCGTTYATPGVTAVRCDASGYHEQRSPDYTGTASIDYHHGLFGGTLALDATASYQSRVYFDSIQYATQKGYGVLNLRADWTDPSGHITLSVYGKNVTDTTYISQVLPDSAYFGQHYGDPATVGGEVRYRF